MDEEASVAQQRRKETHRKREKIFRLKHIKELESVGLVSELLP